MGHLHGGATATIFDVLTTVAIAPLSAEGKFRYAGVSRTLNVTYLRPIVGAGKRVRVECEVVQVGRRLCAIRAVVRDAGKVKDDAKVDGIMKSPGKGAVVAKDNDGTFFVDGVRWGKEGEGEIMAMCEHNKASKDPEPSSKL